MTPHSTPSGPAGASPGPDPYRDAGSGVLRNRLGITDPNELEVAEADFSAVRLAGLQQRPLPGDYDLAHMQRFHERIFGDVYPWAGQLRTVVIAKGGTFCVP
jgi:cell filamentation protein